MHRVYHLLALTLISVIVQAEPFHNSELIFPLQNKHVHSSSIVELPNGDLLTCWFHGSGERKADDVLVQGARLKKVSEVWSEVFLMADTPGLPDCNPVLFLDRNKKLWMFWIAVRAQGWQHSILRYKTTNNYDGDMAPDWTWQDIIVLKPGDSFADEIKKGFDILDPSEDMWSEYAQPYSRMIIEAAKDAHKRQEGWMTRTHPLQLSSGRILLPLYSDGFNICLAAISDDDGATWCSSGPMVGLAGIQPSIVSKQDGTLSAYLRDGGEAPGRALYCESKDQGSTWSVMRDTAIPNPGSSLEVIALHRKPLWAMIYNDVEHSRSSMAVALSGDEGKTWQWKRHIGQKEYYAYPSIIQTQDGLIHITYTYKNAMGKSIKHEIFDIDWIKQGDLE